MKKIYLFIFLLNFIFASAQIIPSNRIADWSFAGYPDSFPEPLTILDVTTFGAVGDSLTDNSTSIMDAIDSLHGQRGVIYFPAGKYIVGSTISLNDSVILRGASSDSTWLLFNLNGITGNGINVTGTTGNFTNVTAGATIFNNYITVIDTAGFYAGCFAELLENNGTWDTQPVSWADNSVGQILKITAISGDTLFFNSPLRITYDSLLNPRVRVIQPKKETGIECMQLQRLDTAAGTNFNIYFLYAANCWVRGVESSLSVGSHIEIDASTNITVTGCHIHHSYLYDGVSTHGYGLTLFNHTGECLITNNIMRHLRHSFSLQTGANGNVISYNYSFDPNRSEVPANAGADISLHGHYPYMNLFEGNIVQNIQIDQARGPSGPFNTFFRNRAELYGLVMTSGTVESDSQNFVGNEIPNTQLFMGNYILAGTGHLEFANNVKGVITPPGATSLDDTSYYLQSIPPFWQSGPFPSIGMPNIMPTGSIPAKDRYLSGANFTVCNENIPVSINIIDKATINIYPNPTNGILKIQTDQKELSIKVKDLNGRIIMQENFSGETIVLTLPENLPDGIYMLHFYSNEINAVKKIMLLK